jgi:hypothetical protein
MERTNLTQEDKGKRVVSFDGDKVGIVSGIDGDAAHVDPDAGLSDSIRSKMGWSSDGSPHVLPADRIETVTDDEIKLKDD